MKLDMKTQLFKIITAAKRAPDLQKLSKIIIMTGLNIVLAELLYIFGKIFIMYIRSDISLWDMTLYQTPEMLEHIAMSTALIIGGGLLIDRQQRDNERESMK